MITDTIFGSLEEGSANAPAPEEGQPDQQIQSQEPSQAPEQGEPQSQAPDNTGQPQGSVDDPSQQGQPDGQFKSPEDLARSYQELRSAYNRRDEEISQLRQQNQQLMAYLQQAMYAGYPQQGQPQQQAPAQAQEQQVDPEQWMEELQRKGPAAVQEIVNREVEKQARELGVGLQQLLTPLFQYYQVAQYRDGINAQIRQLAQKYPDAGQYADEMEKVAKENVNLLLLPNGAEMIYQAAKLRVLESQNRQQQSHAQKRAAQMPSTGASRPGPQPTPEDIIRQQVFGAVGKPQGIFD